MTAARRARNRKPREARKFPPRQFIRSGNTHRPTAALRDSMSPPESSETPLSTLATPDARGTLPGRDNSLGGRETCNVSQGLACVTLLLTSAATVVWVALSSANFLSAQNSVDNRSWNDTPALIARRNVISRGLRLCDRYSGKYSVVIRGAAFLFC